MSSPVQNPEAHTSDPSAPQPQVSESPLPVTTSCLTSNSAYADQVASSVTNVGSTEVAIRPSSLPPAPPTQMAPPPLPYGSYTRPNFNSGGPQQSPSMPAFKFTPAMPPAALQPPAPMQTFGNRPFFSYNAFPGATVNSSSSQQFRPHIATNQMHVQAANQSFQPPVPAQHMSPNQMIPGYIQQTRPTSSNFSFWVPQPTPPTTANVLEEQKAPTNDTRSITTEDLNSPQESASSQSDNPSSTTSSSAVSAQSPNPKVASASMQSSQNIQNNIYSPYPSVPAISPSSQGTWLGPPLAGTLQPTLHLPYASPFPSQMQAMPLPYSSAPNMQPPGVLTVKPENKANAPNPDYIDDAHDLCKPVEAIKSEEVDVWTAHKTGLGTVYYYNSVTGESTYNRPSSFKGEPDKIAEQPTPVSCEKIIGTDWTLITTNDGKKYYYDNKNKVSSWQVPSVVAEMRKNLENDSSRANKSQEENTIAKTENHPTSIEAPALQTGGRESVSGQVSSSALDLIKKKLQDTGSPSNSEVPVSKAADATTKGDEKNESKEKIKESNGDENMSDSVSSDSDAEESGPSKDDCVNQFKEMLKERGVAPFSKWDKELPKILFDSRFKAVPSHSARRSIFEHFVRTRAEEERKEKRAAQKAAIDGFKQLLEEATEDIDYQTDYQSFKRKWGKDSRFEALDRKERELLLNEKVLTLKRVFEEKNKAMHIATVTSFKTMLKEYAVTVGSRWSKVKDTIRSDPRYKSLKHEERELVFNEYISELKAIEGEAEQASKAKKDEHDKLKEREREMRKRKEREEQEMEKIRLKIRKKEAISSYQALLVEIIKDPKATWTESKPRLEKDPQGRATNPDLDEVDAEKLFREHVKDLLERCAREYRYFLEEILSTKAASKTNKDGKNALNSWTEAKQLLEDDPRYSKMPRKEREYIWRKCADDIIRRQKVSASDKKDKLGKEVKDLPKMSPRSHGVR